MDLLKVAIKLSPFGQGGERLEMLSKRLSARAETLADALEVSILSRTVRRKKGFLQALTTVFQLDVAASPYDASDYGQEDYLLPPIAIETADGKNLYKAQQVFIWQQTDDANDAMKDEVDEDCGKCASLPFKSGLLQDFARLLLTSSYKYETFLKSFDIKRCVE
eukprot:756323-Hanusia_phi.AAC.6